MIESSYNNRCLLLDFNELTIYRMLHNVVRLAYYGEVTREWKSVSIAAIYSRTHHAHQHDVHVSIVAAVFGYCYYDFYCFRLRNLHKINLYHREIWESVIFKSTHTPHTIAIHIVLSTYLWMII